MKLNIPQTSTVSHELPIFTQMSEDSGIPVSEVKARFRQEMIEQHRKAMDDPSMMPMNYDGDTIPNMAVESLSKKLENPEEATDEEEEYNRLFNLEPGEQDPSAEAFSMDNYDLGFSDEGMESLNSVEDDFGDFGSDLGGSDINAMSEFEPVGAADEEAAGAEAADGEFPEESAETEEGDLF